MLLDEMGVNTYERIIQTNMQLYFFHTRTCVQIVLAKGRYDVTSFIKVDEHDQCSFKRAPKSSRYISLTSLIQ